MKNKCEIIFNDDVIENVDDHLSLEVGDVFYFSIRGTTPRSEEKYLKDETTSMFPTTLLHGVIDAINKKAHEHHIREFKVIKVTKSYQKDHHFSISEPDVQFHQSITVKETVRFSDIVQNIKNFFRKK